MSDGTVPVTAQAAPSVSGPLDTSGSGAPPSTTTPPSSHSHDHPPPPTDSSTATTAVAGNETAPGVGSNGNARFTESPPHSQHISRARSRTVSSVSTSDIPLHERHPPPFSKPVTRALFLRPAHTRGPAPGLKDSIISAFTYSKRTWPLSPCSSSLRSKSLADVSNHKRSQSFARLQSCRKLMTPYHSVRPQPLSD